MLSRQEIPLNLVMHFHKKFYRAIEKASVLTLAAPLSFIGFLIENKMLENYTNIDLITIINIQNKDGDTIAHVLANMFLKTTNPKLEQYIAINLKQLIREGIHLAITNHENKTVAGILFENMYITTRQNYYPDHFIRKIAFPFTNEIKHMKNGAGNNVAHILASAYRIAADQKSLANLIKKAFEAGINPEDKNNQGETTLDILIKRINTINESRHRIDFDALSIICKAYLKYYPDGKVITSEPLAKLQT